LVPSGPSEPVIAGQQVADCGSNHPEAKLRNENPGALAGATGAECFTKEVAGKEYTGLTGRAIVALLEAAEAGDADACTVAIRALRKLPGLQVATIAACAFFALDDDAAEDVIRGVLRRAGWPLPDALAPMYGARLWARDASRSERKAFALAAFEALGTDDQQAFLRFTGGPS